LNNGLILWDSPGLGDGKKEDELHKLKIKHKLTEKTDDGSYLIDLVLVILDASTRDLGTSYDLINNAVIPYLGNTPSSRIIVAINQADRAMKGTQGWNYEAHCPTPIGEDFLEKKVFSISKRIKESTNVDITPIYYSAGYKDELEYHPPYNLLKLLYLVIEASPEEKRAVFRETLSPEKENWKYNDHKKDYGKQTRNNLSFDTIVKVGMSILGAIFGFFG
jgi:predicted GTPase